MYLLILLVVILLIEYVFSLIFKHLHKELKLQKEN